MPLIFVRRSLECLWRVLVEHIQYLGLCIYWEMGIFGSPVVHAWQKGPVYNFYLMSCQHQRIDFYHLPAAYFCLILLSSLWRVPCHRNLLPVLEVATALSHLQAFIYFLFHFEHSFFCSWDYASFKPQLKYNFPYVAQGKCLSFMPIISCVLSITVLIMLNFNFVFVSSPTCWQVPLGQHLCLFSSSYYPQYLAQCLTEWLFNKHLLNNCMPIVLGCEVWERRGQR